MLGDLVEHVADAIDRYRDGELDALEVDRLMFQYSHAAKELWKFCNMGHIELIARHVHDDPPIDWWERGAPKPRPRAAAGT
jgi:hypothetical protein